MRCLPALLSIILFSQVNLAAFAANEPKATNLDRPTMILVENLDCPVCKEVRVNIAPVVEKYKSKINYIRLAVDDNGATAEAQKKAKELGVDWFLTDSAATYPCVGAFSKKGRLVRELVGLRQATDYDNAVQKMLKP
ncbi:MAG: hypothetical protein SGJ27_09320 [Candidatus Melainabacteria bacterium]|nr:hypothetical protein [Candidatus Melainabacteria bacterium]